MVHTHPRHSTCKTRLFRFVCSTQNSNIQDFTWRYQHNPTGWVNWCDDSCQEIIQQFRSGPSGYPAVSSLANLSLIGSQHPGTGCKMIQAKLEGNKLQISLCVSLWLTVSFVLMRLFLFHKQWATCGWSKLQTRQALISFFCQGKRLGNSGIDKQPLKLCNWIWQAFLHGLVLETLKYSAVSWLRRSILRRLLWLKVLQLPPEVSPLRRTWLIGWDYETLVGCRHKSKEAAKMSKTRVQKNVQHILKYSKNAQCSLVTAVLFQATIPSRVHHGNSQCWYLTICNSFERIITIHNLNTSINDHLEKSNKLPHFSTTSASRPFQSYPSIAANAQSAIVGTGQKSGRPIFLMRMSMMKDFFS